MDPLMMEVLNVNLEEVFIYKMEKKGYGVYDEWFKGLSALLCKQQ